MRNLASRPAEVLIHTYDARVCDRPLRSSTNAVVYAPLIRIVTAESVCEE
jgi:hypothetical protein